MVLCRLFRSVDLVEVVRSLQLNNKYEQALIDDEQTDKERAVRSGKEHVFILSSHHSNVNERSIFNALNTSITHVDSVTTETKLPA